MNIGTQTLHTHGGQVNRDLLDLEKRKTNQCRSVEICVLLLCGLMESAPVDERA
jgi:hypothetical protein